MQRKRSRPRRRSRRSAAPARKHRRTMWRGRGRGRKRLNTKEWKRRDTNPFLKYLEDTQHTNSTPPCLVYGKLDENWLI
jgi:hypothetical protein